jgi:hypothetical protein
MDFNGSAFVFAVPFEQMIYFVNKTGNITSNCSTLGLNDGFPFGVSFDDNLNNIWVNLVGGTSNQIVKTNSSCANLSTAFNVVTHNTLALSYSNGLAYLMDDYASPDVILVYNSSSGSLLYNITWASLTSETFGSRGVWVSKNDFYGERVYLSTISSNDLTYVSRVMNKTGLLWNCYGCDIYNNCNWSKNGNFTFDVRNPCVYRGSNDFVIECDRCPVINNYNLSISTNLILSGNATIIFNNSNLDYVNISLINYCSANFISSTGK